MFKNALTVLFVTLSAIQAFAQQLITGKITDLKENALPYINIGIKGRLNLPDQLK